MMGAPCIIETAACVLTYCKGHAGRVYEAPFCAVCQRQTLARRVLLQRTLLGLLPLAAQTAALTLLLPLTAMALARMPSHQDSPAARRCVQKPCSTSRVRFASIQCATVPSSSTDLIIYCQAAQTAKVEDWLTYFLSMLRLCRLLTGTREIKEGIKSRVRDSSGTMQGTHTGSNPFGPTSASSNGGSGFGGSAFGQQHNGFRSQEYGSQALGIVHCDQPEA